MKRRIGSVAAACLVSCAHSPARSGSDHPSTLQTANTTAPATRTDAATTDLTTTPAIPAATVRRWDVRRRGVRVLALSDTPGLLMSISAPPPRPNAPPPPAHPFLSAVAYTAADEGELRRILDASRDLADFLARLRAAGFDVVEAP